MSPIAQLSERNRLLANLAVTEETLAQLKLLDYAEACWRIQHEFDDHCKWAAERRDFTKAEIDAAQPAKPKSKPPANTPPIQSHRTGHGMKSNTMVFGEKFG